MPDESAPPHLPDAPSTLVDDREVERWLDEVAQELQRVLDEASAPVTPPVPLRPIGAGPASLRDEATELRTWSRREADTLVDETRRQVLAIYERLKLGVLDLTE